jgi:hypothetical protein
MSSDRDAFLALLVEEYKVLTSRGAQTDQHTYTALQWGTGFVLALMSACLSQWDRSNVLVEVGLLLIIPSVVAIVQFYWLGEVARRRRIYDYIYVAETKAAAAFECLPEDGSPWTRQLQKSWQALAQVELTDLSAETLEKLTCRPLSFEHWLRELRATHAPNNLLWVHRLRFGLFPFEMSVSLGLGVFYVFAQRGHLDGWSTALVAVGLLFGLSAIWLGAELALPLDRVQWRSTVRAPRGLRRFMRNCVGRLLSIPEWQTTRSATRS